MSKLVHFLGYTAAIVVVGILVMTATGQLSPALRGSVITSSAPYPNVATPTAGGTVTPDGQFTVTKGADGTYTVTENAVTNTSPAAMMGAGTTGGSSGGDTGGDGGAMMAAAAVTCQPGIVTRGPQDPPKKNYKINCPKVMPNDSYFKAAAITELQNNLGCTAQAAGAAQIACPDSTNCQKDGAPTLQTPNPFTTCTVTNQKRDAKSKTCTADVDCTAAQCDYKQNCKPKPRKTCCYSDNKTVATCRDGAGTCAAGEEVGTDYAADQCAMNCKPVNTRCCKPTTGTWSCSATCPAGVPSEIKTITECPGACMAPPPPVYCCKNGLANTYGCKTACAANETQVAITGMCDPTMNCKASASSTAPAVCCRNSNNQFYCRQSCQTGEIGVAITGMCDITTNCTISSASSVTSIPVSVCCKTGDTYACSPNCPSGTIIPITGNQGVCDTNINCKSSSSVSSPPTTQKCCATITGTGVMRSCKTACGTGETEVNLSGQQCNATTCVPTSGSSSSM